MFLPDPTAQILAQLLGARLDRVRALHQRENRELGALSIELALLVAALVVIAGVIVAILTTKATQKGNAIP